MNKRADNINIFPKVVLEGPFKLKLQMSHPNQEDVQTELAVLDSLISNALFQINSATGFYPSTGDYIELDVEGIYAGFYEVIRHEFKVTHPGTPNVSFKIILKR